MATHMLTFHDGKLEVPEDLQRTLGLQEGRQLRVVYSAADRLILASDEIAQPQSVSAPNWRNVQGSLSHLSRSPNIDLRDDLLRERELDVRF